MRSWALISLLVLSIGSCGSEDDAPAPEAAPDSRPIIICPVEGTKFRTGMGVPASVPGHTVEVCSPGCRYRIELEPERYPLQKDGR